MCLVFRTHYSIRIMAMEWNLFWLSVSIQILYAFCFETSQFGSQQPSCFRSMFQDWNWQLNVFFIDRRRHGKMKIKQTVILLESSWTNIEVGWTKKKNETIEHYLTFDAIRAQECLNVEWNAIKFNSPDEPNATNTLFDPSLGFLPSLSVFLLKHKEIK